MKIRKGDTVKIISGNDRGKTGEVLRVQTKERRVVVAGVGVSKRRVGTVEFNRPISVSNTMLVCPKCKEAVRVGYEVADGEKIRVCKKCGAPMG